MMRGALRASVVPRNVARLVMLSWVPVLSYTAMARLAVSTTTSGPTATFGDGGSQLQFEFDKLMPCHLVVEDAFGRTAAGAAAWAVPGLGGAVVRLGSGDPEM